MPCRSPGEGGGLQAQTQGGFSRPNLRGVGVSQHALRQNPRLMATAAGGMHPTGTQSCYVYESIPNMGFKQISWLWLNLAEVDTEKIPLWPSFYEIQ